MNFILVAAIAAFMGNKYAQVQQRSLSTKSLNLEKAKGVLINVILPILAAIASYNIIPGLENISAGAEMLPQLIEMIMTDWDKYSVIILAIVEQFNGQTKQAQIRIKLNQLKAANIIDVDHEIVSTMSKENTLVNNDSFLL